MDRLEFENFEIRSGKICSATPRPIDKEVPLDQEKAIETSVNIVRALEKKMKSFNRSDKSKRVTLIQLKRIFVEAVQSGECGSDKPKWGMARVNMFLRMKKNNIITPEEKKDTKELKEIVSIELEQVETKKIKTNELINIASSWTPSEKDFELAEKDVEKYEIFKFNSVNDLYLEEYKSFDKLIDWKY
jgi:hypothetical protein